MAADTLQAAQRSPATGNRAEIDGHPPTPAELIEAEYAPGWPGIPGRRTSSAKSGVGTALSPLSHVWFTLSHGILNEIYHPRIDRACTRDLGLIVTDGASLFSEEKRHAKSEVRMLEDGRPRLSPRQHLRERSLPQSKRRCSRIPGAMSSSSISASCP